MCSSVFFLILQLLLCRHHPPLNNDLSAKALVNTYYDETAKKLYLVNADGTKGSEIPMGSRLLDYSNSVELNPSTRIAISYTTPKDGILIVSTRVISGDDRNIYINNKPVFTMQDQNVGYQGTVEGIPKGAIIKTIGALYEDTSGNGRHLIFVPYK